MNQMPNSRDVLIRTTAELLRTHGYAGTGVAEILARSGLPKGSLYHHFPGGKTQLAAVATRRVADLVTRRIHESFARAASFAEGMAHLCDTLANLAAGAGSVAGCPVASIAQADAPSLRDLARSVLAEWTQALETHARRLGSGDPETRARLVVMELQGAWMVAAIEGKGDAFARLRATWRVRE